MSSGLRASARYRARSQEEISGGAHKDISERVIVLLMPVGLLFESGPVFIQSLTQTSIHHKRWSRILQLIDHTAPLH
jgi:hypothetical protein